MNKLLIIIALSIALGADIALMVATPADVYWAHWVLMIGAWTIIVWNTLELKDKIGT